MSAVILMAKRELHFNKIGKIIAEYSIKGKAYLKNRIKVAYKQRDVSFVLF